MLARDALLELIALRYDDDGAVVLKLLLVVLSLSFSALDLL